MTRCPDLYDKLDRDGNFCGLSSSAISKIKAYRELIDKIEKAGIDRAFAYENFSEGASRAITSLNDDESRGKGLNYVIARLKQKEKITAPELKKMVAEWLNSGSTDGNLGDVSKKLPIVRTPTEQKPSFPVEKPTPAGQTLTEKMAAQQQQPVFYKPDPAPAPVPAAPPRPPASMTPDKERIVKECLTAILTPKVMGMVDAMVAGGQWEKTYLDFLVIVIKDGITRKL